MPLPGRAAVSQRQPHSQQAEWRYPVPSPHQPVRSTPIGPRTRTECGTVIVRGIVRRSRKLTGSVSVAETESAKSVKTRRGVAEKRVRGHGTAGNRIVNVRQNGIMFAVGTVRTVTAAAAAATPAGVMSCGADWVTLVTATGGKGDLRKGGAD